MVAFTPFFLLLTVFSSVLAHPVERTTESNVEPAGHNYTDFEVLYQGNQVFQAADPELLQRLADNGQEPPFLFLGCSDSRVSEGTVFNAKPGTLFAERNIANQFLKTDLNARSIIAYGVDDLKVRHIIVMGHYGCGGVAAAIASPPPLPWDDATAAIQTWIRPIRQLYHTSTRPEVVELRKQNQGKLNVTGPPLRDPGYRALIEENIKNTVENIVAVKFVAEHLESTSGPALSIHGWVYDIENGKIRDLNVTQGHY